ncbi:MAG: hypothetical protein AAF798_16165, partial [Bacteroidota bacterium]
RIIHSLSSSEKRYFKLFANAKSDRNNKYLILFNAIEAQSVFDDDALRQLIYEGQSIQSRKYSELKAYLLDLILKSLQAYDEKTSISYRMKHILQSIRVLYKRALFDDCFEFLQKGYKFAEKYERHSDVLALCEWEKELAYAKTDIPYLDKSLEQIQTREQKAIAAIQNLKEYRDLFFQLLVSLRKDASLREPAERDRLRQMLQTPLLESIERAASHQAKVLYHRIYVFYYYIIADYNNFYEEGLRLVHLMESQQHFLKEEVKEYISALSNLAISCMRTQNYVALEATLKKIKAIHPLTKDDELKIHRQYYTLYFRWCIDTGNFEEGLRALEQHFQDMPANNARLFETDSFYFQYFYIYFGVGQYDEALDYLNKWLNTPRSVQRQDLQGVARILNLIIHFEMGNTLLLESLLRATYRFLRKRNRLYQYEEAVLQFIQRTTKLQSRKEMKASFVAIKERFAALRDDPRERFMLQLFDLEAWLESKISNTSFAQIKLEKYNSGEFN